MSRIISVLLLAGLVLVLVSVFTTSADPGPCDGLTGPAADSCAQHQAQINEENRDAGQWP